MSNVKSVSVSGVLPFDCAKHHDLCKFMGQLNAPVFGLRLMWGHKEEFRPNAWGGRTVFVPFVIAGREAVSVGWVKELLQSIVDANGEVAGCSVSDTEAGERCAVEVPKPRAGEFVAEFRLKVANPETLDKAEPAWSVGRAVGDLKLVLPDDPASPVRVTVMGRPVAIRSA